MAEKLARIFSVERFAIHDGAGIRTTVFFKGCPLQCAWCHNPEGIAAQRQVLYMEKKCIHCGSCVQAAQMGGVRLAKNNRLCLDMRQAEDWDRLLDICPTGALAWDSWQTSLDELLQTVLRDEVFFRHGGGVTASGGEPLLQADFLQAFLSRLQAQGVHTALESSLQVPLKELQKVLPHLDQIYADCKLWDSQQHRCWTGQDNVRLRENIRWLLQSAFRSKVVIRTPMIPGITAIDENIAAIADFLRQCWPESRYELLNYNPLAPAKYSLLQKRYGLQQNLPRYTKAELIHFAAAAKRQGLRRVSFIA